MGLEQPPELLLEMFRREPPQTMRLMTYYPPCRQRQAGKVIGAHQPDATAPCERRAGPAYQGWQVDHHSPVNGLLVVNILKVLLP
jgi:hypothetical protein